MDFSPTSGGCTRSIRCTADINGQCPNELWAPGGCNNPCTVFKTDEYCCNSGNCGPTAFSRFFKKRCPDAYSYPKDDQTSTFICPGGTNYKVVFCSPKRSSGFKELLLPFSVSKATVSTLFGGPPYLVVAAALSRARLTLNIAPGTTGGRVWDRTGCNFDGASQGRCRTGDCGGVLQCRGYGQPPNTLAEYSLNQYQNLDFIDISLVDGFNVPMEFSPTSGGCTSTIRCIADINGQCPNKLRALGGCNNMCTVYKTNQYCCNSGSCGPTPLSRFFKERCPNAYSYRKDDPTSLFTCFGGTNYRVAFCPPDIASGITELLLNKSELDVHMTTSNLHPVIGTFHEVSMVMGRFFFGVVTSRMIPLNTTVAWPLDVINEEA
ncbi:hypothetical protein RHSIM_Rhsim07G0093100 [Rhododendron simsii]|uniref:Thaumatin-like protein n=1 Tax=Rhododendron simsii TaxID=118357 RepID=A0A834GNL8_RHOSS|nr:hypothetical protein RHSIM_Rhsim07G0093100 [Rhododendron simsii]